MLIETTFCTECGAQLEAGAEPGDTCRICQVMPPARHGDVSQRYTGPVDQLAEAYARLRSARTGKTENARDFHEEAERDFNTATARVCVPAN